MQAANALFGTMLEVQLPASFPGTSLTPTIATRHAPWSTSFKYQNLKLTTVLQEAAQKIRFKETLHKKKRSTKRLHIQKLCRRLRLCLDWCWWEIPWQPDLIHCDLTPKRLENKTQEQNIEKETASCSSELCKSSPVQAADALSGLVLVGDRVASLAQPGHPPASTTLKQTTCGLHGFRVYCPDHVPRLGFSRSHTMTLTVVFHIVQAADALFGLVLVGDRVASLAQPRGSPLHPRDLLALQALLKGTPSLRAAQTFLPVCLPRFNPAAFLHAYVHFLPQVCLQQGATWSCCGMAWGPAFQL